MNTLSFKSTTITSFFTIILLFVFLSCTGQVPKCDTIYIEDPTTEAMILRLTKENSDLTASNQVLTDINTGINTQLDAANSTIAEQDTTIRRLGDIIETDGQKMTEMDATIKRQENEILVALDSITTLGSDLADCLAKPVGIDTVYVDKPLDYITVGGVDYKVSDIELIKPFQEIDTILVSHSNDDKTSRKFFHHGPFEAPFPKDITFETKELCMITVKFPDSLGTYRSLDQFKVKRIRDYTLADTFYEFIK